MRHRFICVAVFTTSLFACTKHNPNVCCVTDPECASIGFEEHADCPSGLVCDNLSCVTPCEGRCGGTSPFCAADNRTCVECIKDSQCPAERSLCNPTTNTCGACVADSDCASQVCDVASGTCEEDANIIYVSGGATVNNDCTQAAPCTFDRAAILVDESRPTIRILPGVVNGHASFTKTAAVQIVGTGATLSVETMPGDGVTAIALTSGTTMNIRGLHVVDLNALGAITCAGGAGNTLNITDADIEGLINNSCDGEFSHLQASTIVHTLRTLRMTFAKISGSLILRGMGTATSLTVENAMLNSVAIGGTGALDAVISYASIANGVRSSPEVPAGVSFVDDVITKAGAGGDAIVCTSPCSLSFRSVLAFPQATPLGGNVMVSDPKFVAPPGDLHLQADSPAIDASTGSPPLFDLDNNPRPSGARADLGAYEFH